ncbi:MAG: thioredoxin family protein [Planctomycetota bacterium]|nr:thioredoxin family protein [Planctomycetota bacterium]MCX8040404.1 thioredoxin family protein [Planctomycetota bacterium]MDW8372220.1 thioredoxin family protein [Planctomycetota bacterium]
MSHPLRWLALLALAAVVLALEPITPGTPAPAFTLPNAQGASVSLADFAGKIVVLEWVNFDCPFVRKFYRSGTMQELQREAAAQGVIWLSICSSAPGQQGYFAGKALLDRIAAERAAPTHYLIDADGTVGRAYGARTTPQFVIIDREGVVRYSGAIDSIRSADPSDIPKAKNYVRNGLRELIAGQPLSDALTPPYGCSVKYAR